MILREKRKISTFKSGCGTSSSQVVSLLTVRKLNLARNIKTFSCDISMIYYAFYLKITLSNYGPNSFLSKVLFVYLNSLPLNWKGHALPANRHHDNGLNQKNNKLTTTRKRHIHLNNQTSFIINKYHKTA